jgi:hypothetical protein
VKPRERPRRKAISPRIKKIVLERQRHCCAHAECKFHPLFIKGDKIQFDHRPPLEQRPVNRAGTDYIPPQLDPDFIDGLHVLCHLHRTVGRMPGAEKTVTTKGSDAWLAKKFRRLEGRTKPKRYRPIVSRGFSKINRPFPKLAKLETTNG